MWSLVSFDQMFLAFCIMVLGYIIIGGIVQSKSAVATRAKYGVAIVVILVLCGLMTGTGTSTQENDLPDEFVFISGIIQEPDVLYGSKGKIWVWIRTQSQPGEPVSLALPYNDNLAEGVRALNLLVRKTGREIPIKIPKSENDSTFSTTLPFAAPPAYLNI